MADILARVQKLLQLGKRNDSPQEAANALALAQDLMFKYQISEADLDAGDEQREREAVVDEAVYQSTSTKKAAWKSCLAYAIARGFGCHMYTMRDRAGTGGHQFQVVGLKSVVQTVSYLYGYASLEIERLCAEEWERRRSGYPGVAAARNWKNNFRLGAVAALRTRLDEQRGSQESVMAGVEHFRPVGIAHSSSALALYRSDAERVDQEYRGISKRLGLRRTARRGARHNPSAYSLGREAGQSLSLGGGRGLAGAKSRIGG